MTIILLTLLLFFFIRKKYDYILYLFIFSNLVIPRNNNFEALIGFISKNIIWDTRLWLLIIMSFILAIKGGKKLLIFSKIEIIVFTSIWGILIIGILIGRQNHNSYLTSDIRLLLEFILTYIVLQKWINLFRIDSNKIIKTFIISGIVYSCLTIFIYLFLRGSFLAYLYGDVYGVIWGNRVTFPNNTAQYIFLFLSIYMIFIKKNRMLNTIAILLNSISLLMSQNRTLISLGIIMIFFILIYLFLYKAINKKITSLYVGILFFTIPILLLLGIVLVNSPLLANSDLIGEVLSRFTNEGSGSVDYRIVTNEYAIESVQNSILGDGLGKEIMSGGGSSLGSYKVSFVDNVFVSLYVKLGVVGTCLVALIIIYGFILNLKAYIVSKDILFLIILIIYPGYIINASYMTSQFIHSAPVYLAYFLLLFLPKERLYPALTGSKTFISMLEGTKET
ncbi:O-antigen polymerase [Ectobacillus panaciterrae]|uniref:O-antigen polymerase n=1 Tax=Ectobacillus panaciterrae TaxID=363872 RepID=UPI000412A9EB|nr:O-antigen polymerase [Ectobacillus panaciterrae]